MTSLSLRGWMTRLLILALILLATILAGSFWGYEALDWRHVFASNVSVDRDIFFLSRLPRVLLAAIVGMGLASAGASFQGLLRNPLADPYILGVSGGAALGSVVALAVGVRFPWISFCAFASALASTGLVYALATYRRRANPESLLLTGIIFNAFAHAFILLINALAPVEQSQRIIMMLIGSLDAVRYSDLALVATFVVTGVILLTQQGRPLNVLSEGSESAASLGLNPAAHQRRIFFSASLVIGAVVSLSGLIGFVGLFIPHIVRGIWGPDHRLLIPASALVGAIVLIGCDTLARTVGFQVGLESQLPVGAITALLGAPFFLVLLRRLRT